MTLRSKVMTAVLLAGVISTLSATFVSSRKIIQQGETALSNKSRAVLSRIETVREYIASQGGLNRTVEIIKEKYPDGNLPKEAKLEVLKQVPIFPNEKEMEILKKFQAQGDLPEITEITEEELIVYRPVRLSEAQGCLVCHGHPSQSPWGNGKDILGMPMEDWKDGYLHGVFAIHFAVINSEIATLSSEQSDGVKQMSLAIRDLDSITQSNAAAAEETAAAASSLSTQASSMNSVVNQLTEIIEGKQERGA